MYNLNQKDVNNETGCVYKLLKVQALTFKIKYKSKVAFPT